MDKKKLEKMIKEVFVDEKTHEVVMPEELALYMCEVTGEKYPEVALNKILREQLDKIGEVDRLSKKKKPKSKSIPKKKSKKSS